MSAELEKYARDVSVMLSSILGGGSEWFKKIGDEYYVCPKLAGAELQRRKTDAHITKAALFRQRKSREASRAFDEAGL